MNSHHRKMLAPLALGLSLTPLGLLAAPGSNTQLLEEVTVTAQKRKQSLQDTPIAISVLDEVNLEGLGISSLEGLMNGVVSSLVMSPNANAASTLRITIRGNGPIDVGQATREGSVAIYQDGIYLGRTQGLNMELAELQRIEVLRGPQGTLFGRNASGGAISLVSKKPTGKFSVKQTLGAGNYDANRSITHLNLPEFAGVRAKVDYLHTERDGWVKNTAPGEHDYNEIKKNGGRLSLNWQPVEDLAIDYTYDNAAIESTQLYFQLYEDKIGLIGRERERQSKTRFPIETLDPTETDIEAHAAIIDWSVSDNLNVKSLSSYRDLKENADNNYAGTLYASGLIAAEDTQQSQWSQEFQFIGTQGNMEWVAGLYYFREKVEQDIQYWFSLDTDGSITGTGIPFTPITPPTTFGIPTTFVDAEAESIAVYGQATWTWSDRLHLTLGARYTEDEKSGDRFQFASQTFQLDSDHLDGAITLNYDWDTHLSSYIKWGSAYKAGGVSVRSASFAPFEEQVIKTWELGLKSEFLDQRIRVNAALFSSEYEDMQFDFIDPVNIIIVETLNAQKKVEVSGFELELTAVPVNGLIFGLSYTYLDDDMPLQPNPLAGGELQSFEIVQTPRHAGSLTLDYTFSPWEFGVLSAHLDVTSTDRFAHTPVAPPRLDAYTLFNARLTLGQINLGNNVGSLSFSAWGKNLTDEEYSIFGIPVEDPMISTIQAFGTPRTAGVDVIYEF